MMKQWLIQIEQWLFGEDKKQQKPELSSSDEPNPVRRRLFRQVAIGAAGVTGTAGLAKSVVDAVPEPDLKKKYRQDALQGEKELSEREYVVMTNQEKEAMLQSFIDNYNNKS
ncbi:MAG: hypothetical protein N0E59_01400 [Candidatus Thiodiazotropha taylori]|uniref:Uncharacterized protein n=1 Tax=Candidatus Thiodiazotropha taylori TaxID=2792791 RepID=A0A9E4P189_9GAMM|nr:hypothetical protein [Candidatus Thiodiazotropha taylori]MCG8027457.1 hypothetical protein [Candidatus Thiodiazotropha taylori]MCG8107275.1 hypothetical protein [Candidatus Thiodiazotropha taylori]MCG8109398.1 hypothetical protein [Candidatus Thiodiazotropha taylori]MCG8124140.1 hypothetical protein [Candidatus Thiodiazotropha taylori]